MSPSFVNLISYDFGTSREQRDKLLKALKQEKSWTLQQLENMISDQMLKTFQEENEEKNLIYLNIEEKSENVMLFLLRKVMKEYDIWESKILEQIKERTILQEEILPQISNLDEYRQKLQEDIQERKDSEDTNPNINVEEFILDSEWCELQKILEDVLKEYWKDTIQVFIDKIDTLTEIEQKQINKLFQKRWTLAHKVKAYVKINNWKDQWRTKETSSWKDVQATHDYKSRTVLLNEIESE